MISLLFVYVLWKIQWSVFWNIWKLKFWYQFHFPKHWTFLSYRKSRKIDINGMILKLKYESINFLQIWNQILRFHLLTVKFVWFFTTKTVLGFLLQIDFVDIKVYEIIVTAVLWQKVGRTAFGLSSVTDFSASVPLDKQFHINLTMHEMMFRK